MIGGRLRVACYINWPYGHGVALDDVNKRFDDVDRAYLGNEEDLRQVIEIYNIQYIYVGSEELSHYPECVARFNSMEWLEPVYEENLQVYKVVY